MLKETYMIHGDTALAPAELDSGQYHHSGVLHILDF